MRRICGRALPLLAVFLLAQPLAAQQVEKRAGEVVSLVARFEHVGAPADSVPFRIIASGHFSLFSRTEGGRAGGERVLVPFTGLIDERAPAGSLAVATVRLGVGANERVQVVRVQVAERRELGAEWASDAETLQAGEWRALPFRLTNRGNVVDTVRVHAQMRADWEVQSASQRFVLSPGQQVTGKVDVRAARSATGGELATLGLRVRTTAEERRLHRTLRVVQVDEDGTLESLPTTLHVGASSGGQAFVALEGTGVLSGGTRMALRLAPGERGQVPYGLRNGGVAGLSYVRLSRERWSLEAGDLSWDAAGALGLFAQGRGAHGSWRSGGWDVHALLGQHEGGARGGLLGRAGGGRSGSHGRVGLEFYHLGSVGGGPPGARLATSGVSLALEPALGPEHRMDAQLDLVGRTSDDGTYAWTPAARGSYGYTGERLRLNARSRLAPTTRAGHPSRPSEAGLVASLDATPWLQLNGWSFYSRSDAPWRGAQAFSARLGATARRRGREVSVGGSGTWEVGRSGRMEERVGAELGAGLGFGTLWVEGEVWAGQFLSYRTSLSYRQGRQWAWLAVGSPRTTMRPATPALEMGLRARLGAAAVEAAFSAHLENGAFRENAGRVRLTMPLGGPWAVASGVEYQPWSPRSWEASLGVSRAFALPLPLARRGRIEGVVFVDHDGSGVRDVGEEGVAGVTIEAGRRRRTSGEHGRFSLTVPGDARARVDPSSLPSGYLLGEHDLDKGGTGSVALLPTSDLIVWVAYEGGDTAVGALVRLVAENGTVLSALSDERGRARLPAVRPARYDIEVLGPGADEDDVVRAEVDTRRRADGEIRLRLPDRRRKVIFEPGG